MTIQQVAAWLLAVLAGGVASPVIEWVKTKLGWANGNAKILTAVAAVLFTLLTVWANGEILPGTIGWADAPVIFLVILEAASITFRKWFKEN